MGISKAPITRTCTVISLSQVWGRRRRGRRRQGRSELNDGKVPPYSALTFLYVCQLILYACKLSMIVRSAWDSNDMPWTCRSHA
jgi:hypothetical protein